MSNTSLVLTPIDGEPRIHDLLLAERLGFERPVNIRNMIKRNIGKLQKLGTLFTVERVINGGKAKEFYLNQKQSVYICMKSETEKAFDVQAEIVRVFDSYLNGELSTAPKQTSYDDAFMALATHTRRPVQIQHSKLANAVMSALGGADRIKQYNYTNVLTQSGKSPAEWKRLAKAEGMKSRNRTSGKEVLRIKAPHVACGLSLADQLVAGGATAKDSISIGKDSQAIFSRILALGFTPPELLI